MSVFNNIRGSAWICPYCKTARDGEIHFQYGPSYGFTFCVGDRIDWNRPGLQYPHGQRLPNGSGISFGWVYCPNEWLSNWLRTIGQIAPGERVLGNPLIVVRNSMLDLLKKGPKVLSISQADYPPINDRRKYGCPMSMEISIELKNDVIQRIFFSDDEKVLKPDW